MARRESLVPAAVRTPGRKTKRLAFGFGRRFFLIVVLGVLWVIPAFWDLRFLLVMAAWDLCAVLAWAVDLSRLPLSHQLVVERSWASAPSLSNRVDVTLAIRNLSRTPVECGLIDDVPKSLCT